MNKYYFYIDNKLVGQLETSARLGGNDIIQMKIVFGNINNTHYSQVDMKYGE